MVVITSLWGQWYLCWCVIGSLYSVLCLVFFFFKQNTAYDVRISDWSSDVCSSDLGPPGILVPHLPAPADAAELGRRLLEGADLALLLEIGRASCRERVCQYV